MDVRFSSSSNYNTRRLGSESDAVVKKADSQSTKVDSASTSTELKSLERQGVAVSTGEEQVIKALDKVLKAMDGPSTTFEVSVHKQTKAIMVKVLNKDTGELIRELPPEKTLDLIANMMEIAGIIVDEKV